MYIFEIDNDSDAHTVAKFLRYMDTKRAEGKLQNELILAHGCYKGQMATSYIVTDGDFHKFIKGSKWVERQESFLHVDQVDMVATLIYNDNEEHEVLGQFVATSKQDAMDQEAWTYWSGFFWVCK